MMMVMTLKAAAVEDGNLAFSNLKFQKTKKKNQRPSPAKSFRFPSFTLTRLRLWLSQKLPRTFSAAYNSTRARHQHQ